MKNATSLFVSAWLCLVLLAACSLTREQRLQRDYDEFKTWVSDQLRQSENQTEENWRQTRAAYTARTTSLDQQLQQLTNERKNEYSDLKKQFGELDERYTQVILKGKWRHDLLEDAHNTSSITSESLWQAYATFMSNVRLRCTKWESEDWRMAHEVYKDLAKRQDEVAAEVTTEDQIRIKALQMEYHALKSDAEGEEEEVNESES
ncbi:hypothetical protein FVR03_13080 [Pontibacter qinzhouensis]|uniref:DUF6565 domain-containing protein n=1 Tax=Pontibacter qinzhouensis TaxID=2603253 RepID=A0A5C8K5J0_9BACT|nr:DUF6565 domain-containing protein [Pontibacter qinzhouensis]TXK44884.1 hypothetical protein FVR03_13080 [Pontibacter qinzhouensis]